VGREALGSSLAPIHPICQCYISHVFLPSFELITFPIMSIPRVFLCHRAPLTIFVLPSIQFFVPHLPPGSVSSLRSFYALSCRVTTIYISPFHKIFFFIRSSSFSPPHETLANSIGGPSACRPSPHILSNNIIRRDHSFFAALTRSFAFPVNCTADGRPTGESSGFTSFQPFVLLISRISPHPL